MKRWLAPIFLVLALASCGANGLPHSSDVVATVSPAQVTVQVGGTATLTGSGTGFTSAPVVTWWIQESADAHSADHCGKLDSQEKDFTSCPYGFVMFHDVSQFPSVATYYAPQTPGTYHVTFSASQVVTFDQLQKTATATITVTPTP